MTGRRGFSLIEVILAVAIFAGAVAVLGECLRMGMRNAARSRDTTKAELFCESTLNQICAGILPPQTVSGASVDETMDTLAGMSELGDSGWLYSVDVQSIDQTNLMAVTVTVRQDLPDGQHPIEVSLTRWMVDPSTATSSTTSDQSSSSSDTSSSSGSSSTGGQ